MQRIPEQWAQARGEIACGKGIAGWRPGENSIGDFRRIPSPPGWSSCETTVEQRSDGIDRLGFSEMSPPRIEKDLRREGGCRLIEVPRNHPLQLFGVKIEFTSRTNPDRSREKCDHRYPTCVEAREQMGQANESTQQGMNPSREEQGPPIDRLRAEAVEASEQRNALGRVDFSQGPLLEESIEFHHPEATTPAI